MQIAFLASNYTVVSTASRGVFYCHSCRKEEALEVLLGENRQASYMSFLVLFICLTEIMPIQNTPHAAGLAIPILIYDVSLWKLVNLNCCHAN